MCINKGNKTKPISLDLFFILVAYYIVNNYSKL